MSNQRDSQFHTSGVWTVVAPNLKATIKSTGYGSYIGWVQELNGKPVNLSYGPASTPDMVLTLLRQRATGELRVSEVPQKTAAPVKGQSNDSILESMRTDSQISDKVYRDACRKFGQKPQPRPSFSSGSPIVIVAENPYSPQEQRRIFTAFFNAFCDSHVLISIGGRADLTELNRAKLSQHIFDDGYSVWDQQQARMTAGKTVTHAVLTEALKDLGVLGMLHTVESGVRGSRPVEPYSRQSILELRAAMAARSNPPVVDPLHPAEVHRQNVQTRQTVERAAIEQVAGQFPSLNRKSGEFRAKVDKLLRAQAGIKKHNPKATSSLARTHI